ncbi:(2Fe-2S)-binding protein [Kiloniella sp.]|uniref:(2Fe-2S)-binding protein n=1 Tax=Kiloniella sp. TaxID=1938587 RepID=UPI003B026D71
MIKINKTEIEIPNHLREVSLVTFLRDLAGLRGTKFGCGAGLCGACTVHVDGIATRACQVSVDDVKGLEITTIEGLADTIPTGGLHPVQKAWIDGSVPQCGYCQAGQIMTAAALLRRNASPSKEDVKAEMNGNLCRCGTYGRIQNAILQAAKEI